jgi:DNA-binding YbaB/EbfC family protein
MAKGYKRPKGMRGAGGGMGGGGGMMQQLQQMQQQMEMIQAQLAEETVEVTVGGGVVIVTFSGDQVCKGVVINPDVLEDADPEMLQDLLLSAINMGLEKSRALQAERLGPLTGGLQGMIPGM